MKRILSVVFALLLLFAPLAQAETADISLDNLAEQDTGTKVQCIPYTVKKIGDGIYRISDNLGSEPLPLDDFGCYNSSDMYLILGTEKALMVHMSRAFYTPSRRRFTPASLRLDSCDAQV